jgi:phage terminase large subunit-like protein
MTNSKGSSQVAKFGRFCELIGLDLEGFQLKIVAEAFSSRRETLILIPRGNGKTTLLAAYALFHLFSNSHPQIAIGAASREQAGTLFEFARAMVAHPTLAKRVDVTRREIRRRDGHGWLRVVASDGPKQHGLVLSLAIVDELHAHRDDELYIALRTGMMKRPDAKIVTISTAGVGAESALGLLHARALKGDVKRDGALTTAVSANLGMLEWALGEKADIDDMEVVKSANPASWLTEALLQEQRDAVHEIAFRRYHCNQWVDSHAPWISADVWDACSEKPRIAPRAEVILGVDAAIRHDSAAVVTLHRDDAGLYHAEFEVWQPTRERDIEIEALVEFIRAQARKYDVRGVVFDPYFFIHAAQRLDAENIPMVEWRQDNGRMVPATQTLSEVVGHKKLRHGGHPTARSHALNCEVSETERGIRIKKRGKERNDCAVALAMAVEWASRDPGKRTSVYEDADLIVA